MASLATDLVNTPPREKSGERVQERFDYQALWGLALIFKHHQDDADYALIFEFHDDIGVLDDAKDPTAVKFYQVKTKGKGSWSLSDLTRRKKAKVAPGAKSQESPKPESADGTIPTTQDHSIVGKMYHNIRLFGDRVSSVTLVSNAPCDFHSGDSFEFKACAPTAFATLVKTIQDEYSGATETEVELLGFERADLSLKDSSAHIKGKLHDFVMEHVGECTFPLEALFRTIVAECRTKSKYTGDIQSFTDLIREKGICRSDVQSWLDAVITATKTPKWEELSAELEYPFGETLQLRRAWNLYQATVLNQGDEALRLIRAAIRKRILLGFTPQADLTMMIESTFVDVEATARRFIVPFKGEQLKVMIIYELYTQD